jgi:hypothetical protein
MWAYMLFMTASIGTVCAVVAFKVAPSVSGYVVIAAGGASVALSYGCGRIYLERAFGRYRDELTGYRRQLLSE